MERRRFRVGKLYALPRAARICFAMVTVMAPLLGGLGTLSADVVVSEIMYHPPSGALEFLELENRGTQTVDLSGWELVRGVLFVIPDGTELAPASRVVICQDRDALSAATGIPAASLLGNWHGALSNGGETVELRDAAGRVVEALEFSDAPPFDFAADGRGPSLERVCLQQAASVAGNWRASEGDGGTPLEGNSRQICPPPLPVASSPVVINEIYYHPPEDVDDPAEEFIELHNRTDSSVDLHGWRLAGGVEYAFDRAAGPAEIPAGGFLLVGKDPARLAAATGIDVTSIAGPYEGQLSNFADDLELLRPGKVVIDRVAYRQDGVWPARADGLGSSLQLIDPDTSSALPQNWAVATNDRCSEPQRCVFVDNGVDVRWFENIDGRDPGFSGGVPWFHADFDDVANGWNDGRLAVGFDGRVPNGQPWVLTDSTTVNGLHSILLRAEFDFDPDTNPCESDILSLGIDRDDGFVVWLNGVEVARGGMTDPAGTVPAFDGEYRARTVTAGGFREDAPVYQTVWRGTTADLRRGRNVIAIGNYNARRTSSDLYLSARFGLGANVGATDSTPGQPNSVRASLVPPLVASVEHSPAEPISSDTVVIRARVDGPGVEGVDLIYDTGSGEQTVILRDDGGGSDATAADGIWSGSVPPQANDTLVKYRVEATREGLSCPSSWPREGNPSPYTGYYVQNDRPEVSADERLFYIFTPRALNDLTCAEGARRAGTFVDFRGRAYFDIGVKFRGETACNYPKKPIRVKFSKGDTFDGQMDLNFNAGWNDKAMLREQLGFDLLRDAGVAYSETHLARVHTNGGAFHGAYFTIEDPTSSFLRRNDWRAGRPLYKCRSAMLNGSTGGYEARTDEGVARLSEVGAFGRALNSLGGQELIDFLEAELNVESVIDYQAVQVIIIDGDSVVKNWLLYIGPHGRGKSGPDLFAVFAWDIDLSHGQMYLTQDVRHHNIHPLFQTRTYPFVGQGHHGIVNALLQRAPDDYFVKAYYGRMWRLLEEKFKPSVFLAKIDAYDANTIDTVRDDLLRWPRTWGSRGTNPDFWRQDTKSWAQRRYDFLRGYLLANNRTTGGRRFQYTPAPELKITEIHYNPVGSADSLEFIEVRNLEPEAVDLSGWTIPAVGYEFPPGSRAPADGLLLVAKSPAILRASYPLPPGLPVFGPYDGNLRNGGEELRLRDSGLYRGEQYYPETIDVVNYDDDAPWPETADGEGKSLELASLAADNDFATNWRASTALGGTPGSAFLANLPPVVQLTATPLSGLAPLRVDFDASASFDPEGDPFTVRWEFSDGVTGAGPRVSRTFFLPGTIEVTVFLDAERGPSTQETLEIEVLDDELSVRFVRGDVNLDGGIDVSDPLLILLSISGRATLDCDQSGDVDDNGRLEITDVQALLNFLFLSGPLPADPFPACGTDPTGGALTCASFSRCN